MWTSVFVPHAFVVLFVDVNVCFSRGVEGWIPLMTCMSIASCCPSHVRLCRCSSVICSAIYVLDSFRYRPLPSSLSYYIMIVRIIGIFMEKIRHHHAL